MNKLGMLSLFTRDLNRLCREKGSSIRMSYKKRIGKYRMRLSLKYKIRRRFQF